SCALVLVGFQLPGILRYYRAFERDDRKELAAWLQANIASDATIAQDGSIKLETAQKKKPGISVPQQVLDLRLNSDPVTMDTLRHEGVDYAIVSENDYGRFFLK